MKQRILIVENSPDITGAFRSILGFASGLKDSFEFHFAIPQAATTSAMLKEINIPYIEVQFVEIRKGWSLLGYLPMLLVNSFRLRNYVRTHSIRIVHVNDIYNMAGIVLKMLCPELKLVYHVRLLRSSYAKILYDTWLKLIRRSAHAIVAVSKSVLQESREIIQTIPTYIVYDFLPLAGRVIRPETSGKIRFIYPSNYVPGKGHRMAIEAFAGALRQIPDMELIFMGGDLSRSKNKEFKELLRRDVSSKGLNNAIKLQDRYTDITFALSNADVVLMFSESESFSMVCYESMYYGLPVLSTKCGGPEEYIIDGVTGLLINNKDILSMQAAILGIASDDSLRLRLGNQAAADIRRRVREFDSIGQLKDIYQEMLKRLL